MQHKHLRFGNGFRVVLGNKQSQAAQMTRGPGEAEGGPDRCIAKLVDHVLEREGDHRLVLDQEDARAVSHGLEGGRRPRRRLRPEGSG